MTTYKDQGHTVERCKSGLGAATALSAGGGVFSNRHYEERIRFWEAQLRFAEAREAEAGGFYDEGNGIGGDNREPD